VIILTIAQMALATIATILLAFRILFTPEHQLRLEQFQKIEKA
jgi:hypothetical protein